MHEWKTNQLMYVSVVRTIYEKLASAFTEELAVLYHQRVEEISPNIRYCAYNIGEYSFAINGAFCKMDISLYVYSPELWVSALYNKDYAAI